jgi:hypothetical protein
MESGVFNYAEPDVQAPAQHLTFADQLRAA